MDDAIEMQPSEEVSAIEDRFESWLQSDDEPQGETEEQTEEVSEPADTDEVQPDDEETEASEEEVETLNIDGEEITLPKEVAEKVNTIKKRLEADYTRKTQEAAEMRKSAEALHERANRDAAFNQKNISVLAEWQSLDSQLKQYEGVDWGALAENDIGQYSRHKEIRDALRGRQQELSSEFNQRYEQHTQQEAVEHKQRWENTVATVRKAIPSYDTATDAKAVSAAQKLAEKYGMPFDANALKSELNPLVWIGLVELSKHYDLVDKRPVTQKQVAEAPKARPQSQPQKQTSNQSREQKIKTLLKDGRIREASLL